MDFSIIIGLVGSFITIGEAGRTWFGIFKRKNSKEGFNLNTWDSTDGAVQLWLDKFKSTMLEEYKNHIFTEADIEKITQDFFMKDDYSQINYEDKENITEFIKVIINASNEYIRTEMSVGENTIHNDMSDGFSEISEKIDDLGMQSQNENVKKFYRAVERSKNIDLDNIEELINGEYEIDRSNILKVIRDDKCKFISIQGAAGSGKSAICKQLLKDEEFVLATRSENFAEGKRINEIWDCDIEDIIIWLDGKKLFFFIDALEFIADCSVDKISLLQELYDITAKYENTFVITSCRSNDKNAFIKLHTKYDIKTYEVNGLCDDDIDKIADKYPLIGAMKNQKNYVDLLSSPFYINLILSNDFDMQSINDENKFREIIWENILCLRQKAKLYGVSTDKVRETVENIVFSRAKNFDIGVKSDSIDSEILSALSSESIIVKKGNNVRLKYDIFEDICFERYFDDCFDECKGNFTEFYSNISSLGRCVYRRYQIWISNKLFIQDNRDKFIYELIFGDNIPDEWKKQTEIGIVKSKYSNAFFVDYELDLCGEVINEIIQVTNLYAFEPKIIYLESVFMQTHPIGTARESLILHIGANPKSVSNIDKNSIIKLCDDYSKYIEKKRNVEEVACGIIEGLIEQALDNSEVDEYYLSSEEVVSLLYIVYRMADVSKEWIQIFLENIITVYKNDKGGKRKFVRDVMIATLENKDACIIKVLPKIVLEVANTLWFYDSSEDIKRRMYFESDLHGLLDYGLTEYSEYSNNSREGIYSNFFIWNIFIQEFWVGLEWAINFINRAIDTYAKNKPDDVFEIELFFTESSTKKSYYGNSSMWKADVVEYQVPLIIGDIIYILKRIIINTLENIKSEKKVLVDFTNSIKKMIYDKSNNIILLTVIETIGFHFEKELPGYALDLATSIEIIYCDIYRYNEYKTNPTSELLMKQILKKAGIPNLPNRYEKDVKCAELLQSYVSKAYFSFDENIKVRCNTICDYLYSITDNDEEHAVDYLQIEKMDMRKAKFTKEGDGLFLVEPETTGNASKIIQESKRTMEPINELYNRVNKLSKRISDGEKNYDDINDMIDLLIQEMKTDRFYDIEFERHVVFFIIVALNDKELKKSRRNYLTKIWIDRLNEMYSNGGYFADSKVIQVLWMQIDEDIDQDIQNSIKLIILNYILKYGKDALLDEVVYSTQKYLGRNKVLAKRLFYTIIKLAEDEKCEVEYMKNTLDQEIDCSYKTKTNEIIQNYLYGIETIDILNFDIQNYDVELLSAIVNCGLDISDTEFSKVINDILICIINMCALDFNKHGIHNMIYKMKKLFERELVFTDDNVEIALKILFDNVDFSKFTKETVRFYQEIFETFLYTYIDGYIEKNARVGIEDELKKLEIHINDISIEWVKLELEKSLFFNPMLPKYFDFTKLKTEYSYRDKCFLNKQIILHGKDNIRDVVQTVYILKIDELLPEILYSLGICFKSASKNNNFKFKRDIEEVKDIIDVLILKAFVYHSDEIKKDTKLTSAYEDILEILTILNNEKAAVLLDEFRIH